MKVVAISDTHSQHSKINIPECDLIIHAGDSTLTGSEKEVKSFLEWFGNLPVKNKILINGNHELGQDEQSVYDRWAKIRDFEKRDCNKVKSKALELIEKYNIHLLNDSSVTIEGIKFWGSPITPEFCNWAFNRKRGEEIRAHWDKIPYDTNVLITHGPPRGIMDYVERSDDNVGCTDLRLKVQSLNQLRMHIFGHVHSGHGTLLQDNILFANCSILNDNYKVAYQPIILEL